MAASYSPASTFASRVSTFPRMGRGARSGRMASACAARRGLPVPTVAPAGNSASVAPAREMSASRGSARSGTAAMISPSGRAVGRSL